MLNIVVTFNNSLLKYIKPALIENIISNKVVWYGWKEIPCDLLGDLLNSYDNKLRR